jgi:hypothetical protein
MAIDAHFAVDGRARMLGLLGHGRRHDRQREAHKEQATN